MFTIVTPSEKVTDQGAVPVKVTYRLARVFLHIVAFPDKAAETAGFIVTVQLPVDCVNSVLQVPSFAKRV